MKFGENLKEIRKKHKMSQEQLASKVNVTRQSVSKWETGDAYPEMNNILELCKIFGCNINDLVHTDISDLTSLDKEVIMNAVKFSEKKQTQLKSISNIIEMIGKIGKIVLIVAIPFIIVSMLLVPYLVKNIKIENDEINFKTDNIVLLDDNKVEVHDLILFKIDDYSTKEDIITIFKTNSINKIIIYVEIGLLFLIIDLIIMIVILNYVEKLFFNIKNNKTPFIIENISYIKKISYLMIALIIITPFSGMLFNHLLEITEVSSEFDLMKILEILIIFSMSYIFEYGYEIQKDTKAKMYTN